MCDYDGGESATLWVKKFPRARKEHRCEACDGMVKPGARYMSLFSIFEGSCATAKCCLPCNRAIERFGKEHGQQPYPTALVETLQECIDWDAESSKRWRPVLRRVLARRLP